MGCFGRHIHALGIAVLLAGPASAAEPAAKDGPTATPRSGDSRPARREGDRARRHADGNLVGHGGPIKAIAISQDGRAALTGSFDYSMMLWDLTGAAPRRSWRLDHDGAVNAVLFLPGSGRSFRAVSASDDGAIVLSALEGAQSRQLAHQKAHTSKIVALAASEDGRRIASASWDRTARLWDGETLEPGPVLSGHQGPVHAVAFTRDGRRLLTAGGEGVITLWDGATGERIRDLHKHGWGINVLAMLPGPGREQVAFGALNGTIAVVDVENGELVRELEASPRPILALAVIARPGLLAIGGGDGVIRVSRLADGAAIERYSNPFGPVWALAFHDDGRALYYGGLDDFATRWAVSPRAAFEPVDSPFPRRFQRTAKGDDSVAEGEVQFARKCSICHTLTPDGANRAGPTLHGVFGRRIGSLPGYPFSAALRSLDIVWTEKTVAQLFELGPDVLTPGSKMPLQKMTDVRQRDALIAYLRQAGGHGGVPGSGRRNDGAVTVPPRKEGDR